MTRRAADLGMTALAITDHGAMYGAIEFYSAARAAGIKPIIGVETYVAPRGRPRQGGQGRRQPLPHDPAGQGRRRLPQPAGAGHQGAPGRLLLQAAHRQGAAGPARRGAHRHLRLPRRGGPQAPGRWRRAGGPAGRRRLSVHPGSRRTSSSRSRTTACPSRTACTRSWWSWRATWGSRCWPPTTPTTPCRSSTRRTTCCSASGPASNLDTPGRLRFETNEFFLKSPAEMRRLFRGELPDAMDNTAARGRDGRPQARVRPAPPAALPGARWRDRRNLAAQGVRARAGGPIRPDA